jgi:radical SAM protein with 4Fe4S-binding SPASM domain
MSSRMAIASEIKMDAFEDGFLVSNPRVGALSTFSQVEFVAFNLEYVLGKIKAVNPNCSIIVTGGEPLMHPDVFEILDLVRVSGFPDTVMITNGTHLTPETVDRLQGYDNLSYIQISLDGVTAKTHGLTRGESSFAPARQGLQELIDRDMPFKLSPTLHDGNMHEAFELAELAVTNGGWYTPNYLTRLPQDAVAAQGLAITPARAAIVQVETQNKVSEVFGEERIREVRERTKLHGLCSESSGLRANGNFICATGWGELDINWNGNIYPCHLLKDDRFILGNVFEDDFWDVFQVARDKGIRTPSTEFSTCSGCHFVATCGGGCRASALYDELDQKFVDGDQQLCDVNFAGQLQKRLPLGALEGARTKAASGDVDALSTFVDGEVTAALSNFSGLHTRLDPSK